MNDMLKTDSSIEDEKDIIGGFQVLETNLYDMVIDLAYFDKSAGGAMSFNTHFSGPNGEKLRNTQYITSKAGKNYYMVKDRKTKKETGEKRYLPGFNVANAIALLTVNTEIGDAVHETKTINLYDFDAGKEMPVQREVLTGIIGQEITLGVLKQIVDKNQKNDQGIYVPTGETREENEIDKLFRSRDGLTVTEIRAEETEPVFKDKWVAKNKGQTRNKAKAAIPGAGSGGAAPAATPAKSLFN